VGRPRHSKITRIASGDLIAILPAHPSDSTAVLIAVIQVVQDSTQILESQRHNLMGTRFEEGGLATINAAFIATEAPIRQPYGRAEALVWPVLFLFLLAQRGDDHFSCLMLFLPYFSNRRRICSVCSRTASFVSNSRVWHCRASLFWSIGNVCGERGVLGCAKRRRRRCR
jgi:hypothetical protein